MAPPHPAPLRPLDTLWQARAIFWIMLAGEALATVLALAPGVAGDRLAYFGVASFAIQWIALMSLGMLYVVRRWLSGADPTVVVQIALAVLLLSTWLVCGLAWLLLRDLWPVPRGGWLALAIQLTAMALTVGLLGVAAFQNHWRTRQLAVRAKQAELEALRARIRPHFLFNAINTGIALVHARPDATERLLLDLSDLFRAAIAGTDEIPLHEEISLARRYLEIEQLRFGDRLQVRWEMPGSLDSLSTVMLPPLSLQPLVENAIRHGIEPTLAGGHVAIGLHSNPTEVTLVVRNSIAGTPARSTGHGIGLNAVAARIHAFTSGGGRLQTRMEGDEYVAELAIPLTR